MRRFALASHGRLAAGMKDSLEMIAGPCPRVEALCAYTPELPDLVGAVRRLVGELSEGDELFLLTDLLGGSVNNELAQFRELPGVRVVTGMNLALVLSLVLGDDVEAGSLVDEGIESARAQLVRVASDKNVKDEDF